MVRAQNTRRPHINVEHIIYIRHGLNIVGQQQNQLSSQRSALARLQANLCARCNVLYDLLVLSVVYARYVRRGELNAINHNDEVDHLACCAGQYHIVVSTLLLLGQLCFVICFSV